MSSLFTFDDLENRKLRMTEDRYESIRNEIRTGDVFAFGGYERASNVIKLVTRGPVSHVGVVVEFEQDDMGGRNLMLVESTSLDGFSGVQMRWLSHATFDYVGEVWWLQLSDERRARLDKKKFNMFLRNQIGKPYDTKQAIQAGVDKIDLFGLFEANEDFSKLFCSELVMAAYEAAGVVKDINSSEVTPIELCKYNLWKQQYAIRGAIDDIVGYNTVGIE